MSLCVYMWVGGTNGWVSAVCVCVCVCERERESRLVFFMPSQPVWLYQGEERVVFTNCTST